MAEEIKSQQRPRLQELAEQLITPEGKPDRVAKALAALNQQECIKLSPEQWKWVAEDVDLED